MTQAGCREKRKEKEKEFDVRWAHPAREARDAIVLESERRSNFNLENSSSPHLEKLDVDKRTEEGGTLRFLKGG